MIQSRTTFSNSPLPTSPPTGFTALFVTPWVMRIILVIMLPIILLIKLRLYFSLTKSTISWWQLSDTSYQSHCFVCHTLILILTKDITKIIVISSIRLVKIAVLTRSSPVTGVTESWFSPLCGCCHGATGSHSQDIKSGSWVTERRRMNSLREAYTNQKHSFSYGKNKEVVLAYILWGHAHIT